MAETAVQKGGGGCSDVFQSRLCASWRPRCDPNLIRLLKLKNNCQNSRQEQENLKMVDSSLVETAVIVNSMVVAVKRLRFWSKPDHRIEKVSLIIKSQ